MPRIRTIKPDFFISDTVSALPLRARLTWIGLWTHCDDHGRCRDNVKLIKAAVWPLDDVSLRDIESDLDDLVQANVVFRYFVEGKSYIQVTNWDEHQKVDRRSNSTIPAPAEGTVTVIHSPGPDLPDRAPVDNSTTGTSVDAPASSPQVNQVPDDSSNPRESLASDSRTLASHSRWNGKERNGREGNAREGAGPPQEPPLRCPEHLGRSDSPPCPACGDVRRARERWERDNAARLVAAPRCRLHRGQLASSCMPCRSEKLGAA